MSSIVSTIPGVRRAMVERQRALGKRGAVLNGRDIGTVVFPDADIKFFLTAAPEERAERRYKEDHIGSYEETLADMIERDRRDSTRADSPLKVADDAIVVDSTGKTIEDVFAEMMERINPRSKCSLELSKNWVVCTALKSAARTRGSSLLRVLLTKAQTTAIRLP